MASIIEAIRAEFIRYKRLGEGAIAQLSDADLSVEGPNGGNSIAVICWHIAVHEALLRSLAHLSHHVGQILYLAHALRGKAWTYLSIPPGASDAFNQKMSERKKP